MKLQETLFICEFNLPFHDLLIVIKLSYQSPKMRTENGVFRRDENTENGGDRLPLVAVRGDAGGPATGDGRRPAGARRGEAPGEGSRHVEVEEHAVAAAAEAAPAPAPAVAPPRGPSPFRPPRRRRLRLPLLLNLWLQLRLLSLGGSGSSFGVGIGRPGLLNEVGERELVLGLGEVVQHPNHLLPPPRDLLRPRRPGVHHWPRSHPWHPQLSPRRGLPLRARRLEHGELVIDR